MTEDLTMSVNGKAPASGEGPAGDQGYPFSAVLGAQEMRLALLLNAVSPAIGGVLVRGEKGTAKSTAVRGLAALLPAIEVVAGCRFGCDPAAPEPHCPDGPHAAGLTPGGRNSDELNPAGAHPTVEAVTVPARLVELPVGASEDRVVGSLDLERALAHGVRAFEPGLLASAHRGILYVDEVNLLADHLVDVLLDAAAMGRNHVERDAVSVSHPARFVLIGSMNPEEGELRPQLLDRFGLTVDVSASRDPAVRVEVVRRRLDADADPAGFAQRWSEAEAELAAQIVAARTLLPEVVLGDAALRQIAEVCAAFDVDGMRADIVTARTAVAHAAWHGRTAVTEADVRAAALLALPHRRRRNPFDQPGMDADALDQALERARDAEPEPPEPGGGGAPPEDSADADSARDADRTPDADSAPDSAPSRQGQQPQNNQQEPQGDAGEQADAQSKSPEGGAATPPASTAATGQAGRAKVLRGSGGSLATPGRRAAARTGRGRTVRALPAGSQAGPIHLRATVAAAALHQVDRGRDAGPLKLTGQDLRRADQRGKEGNLVLFVVDASASMAARARMGEVKAAILSLLLDAYQRRDKVGLITFRDKGAELVLPPTGSVSHAARRLEDLSTGGRTPLAAGVAKAAQVVRTELLRDPLRRPLIVLITDGRADTRAAARAGAGLRDHDMVVIDCERGLVRLGLAQRLAYDLHAQYLPLAEVTSEPLTSLVNDWQAA
ncbi:MAG TPA: VWA domain-containing protein [Jatrophihabitans sp.]|jgi:magnesium chelatase subunit D|uniref:VWA domain-containing protein n=1 Tax=Jatrophihabitans sp. TaxID=1932789 RepID=UPI002EDCE50C